MTIYDYVDRSLVLTAAEVRKLPPGTKIVRHCIGSNGTYTHYKMIVVNTFCGKQLTGPHRRPTLQLLPISDDSDALCYTAR